MLPAFSGAFVQDSVPAVRGVEMLDDISPAWAWGGCTGRGVKVAVIDSGIDARHPAVGGSIAGYVSIREGDGDKLIFDESAHEDLAGHGTACAGIIRSLAADCELYSVRVLDNRMSGRGRVFAAGLHWAIEHGMNVCNLSLGTTRKDFYGMLHELADEAYFRNVMLVTAANNMPIPSFPSMYASVISVAAHNVQDSSLVYYNPRPPVEFGALGINVRVAWLDGSWLTATGNSFAAPHVAGLVARMLEKHPHLTVSHVKMILRALAANVRSTTVEEP